MERNLEHLKVIGDRVLIYPDAGSDRTTSGLYLPPTVTEKENVQGGYIVAVGPGTAMSGGDADEDVWRSEGPGKVNYLPLEVEEGDYALYLKKYAVEIKYQGERYIIVPISGILVVERDESEFNLDELLAS